MKSVSLNTPTFVALAALFLCVAPGVAQTKPPESTSKVKKVLLYNKIGGWFHSIGLVEVQTAMKSVALAKGFELVEVQDDFLLTPDFLREFQVIVWNNNTNGGKSIPSASAREAVLDYLSQGGGWMLIHGAGDHADTWVGLKEVLGTRFSRHGNSGRAKVVLDSAAAGHRELKWMVEGFQDTIPLTDSWDSYMNTVRPLEGVTVVATAQPANNDATILQSMGDASGDHTYIWAREIGRGRLIFNAIGHGQNNLMAQQDSIVPRLYWENLRYAAGDYQNGCTNPADPGFNPAARVHIEAMCAVTGIKAAPALTDLMVSKGDIRMRLPSPSGSIRIRLRNLSGTLVWKRTFAAGTHVISLDESIKPGVYHIEIRGASGGFHRRLLLP